MSCVRFNLRNALVCAAMLTLTARAQVTTPVATSSTQGQIVAPATSPSPAQSAPITVQLVQPKDPKLPAIQAYAPYIGALLALLGVVGTAIYTLRRGRMDARYTYASEIMKFRLRQVEEFYAPALTYIEQSRIVYDKLRWVIREERKDISLEGFRLLDHIFEFKSDPKLTPLVSRILAIGKQLTGLIAQKSGLIEGGITPTFIEYQGHFEILNAARKQKLTIQPTEGWHERGYYTRLLNREIAEGYKVVLAHLQNYVNAGDKIISELFAQRAVTAGKYRRQLIDNLQYYEGHVKDYVAKFDAFDLSRMRQRFIDEVEVTRQSRAQSSPNGLLKILDAGCGTGRDAYEFVKKGYVVIAVDASPAMLRECRKKLNIARDNPVNPEMKAAAKESRPVEMTFDEIPYRNEFDGVWAAASLLHVPSELMEDTLQRLKQALKPNGVLYMSFKYGLGEYEYDARFYSYYSRKKIRGLLEKLGGIEDIDIWLSDASGNDLSSRAQWWAWRLEYLGRYDRSRWLNVLVRRKRS